MSNIAISINNVSKCYKVFDKQSERLLHALWPKYTKGLHEISALKDINFDIKRGESVAIIGRNGGGKSTLLEILTGILMPTTGKVKINGRVSALLELGSGFNPEYTGRDNVVINGLLLGLSREVISKRFDEIEAFADIGDAIDYPVKTYSSGMLMRLAFAVQVLCDPEILIIDEALSVGDFFFQQKCMKFIKGLCGKGVTLLFVSHDMGAIRDVCQRVIYLKKGEIIYDGDLGHGLPLYFKEQSIRSNYGLQTLNLNAEKDTGLQPLGLERADLVKRLMADAIWQNDGPVAEGKIISVVVGNIKNQPRLEFEMTEKMRIRVLYKAKKGFINHVGITIYDKIRAVRTVSGSLPLGLQPSMNEKLSIFEFDMDLMIEAGQYSLVINLGYQTAKNQGHVLDETGMIGPITTVWDYENKTAPFLGQVGLPSCGRYL